MNQSLKMLIVLLVLGGIGFGIYKYTRPKGPVKVNKSLTSENILVSTTPLGPDNSLPSVFPQGLPVESTNITSHETLDYPDNGVTLYTISYTSSKQLEELYSTYGAYFTKNKITVNTAHKSYNSYYYSVTIGSDVLSVNIGSNGDGRNLVKLALAHKKS